MGRPPVIPVEQKISEQPIGRWKAEFFDYNTLRPHEALAWNRPHDVHLGLASSTIPTTQTEKALPAS